MMVDRWEPLPEYCPEPIGGSVPIRLAHYITLSLTTLCRDASLAFGVEDVEARDLPRAACTEGSNLHSSMREMGGLEQAASRARECGKPGWAVKRQE